MEDIRPKISPRIEKFSFLFGRCRFASKLCFDMDIVGYLVLKENQKTVLCVHTDSVWCTQVINQLTSAPISTHKLDVCAHYLYKCTTGNECTHIYYMCTYIDMFAHTLPISAQILATFRFYGRREVNLDLVLAGFLVVYSVFKSAIKK